MTDTNRRDGMARRRYSRTGIGLTVAGVAACAIGFIGGDGSGGTSSTGWGVLAGIGFATAFIGVIKLWIDHQVDLEGTDPGGARKLERLQAQRAYQLWLFPVMAVVLLVASVEPLQNLSSGDLDFSDMTRLFAPLIYAWLVPTIVMGWDAYSKKNRRFLDDELSRSLRSRAMTAGFFVLMIGTTAAFGLGLWRPELGVAGALFAITAGGAATGVRFAWLYRDAGKDG